MPTWDVDHPITHWTKSLAQKRTICRCVTALLGNDMAGASHFRRKVFQFREPVFHRQDSLRIVDVHTGRELQGRNGCSVDVHQPELWMVGHQMSAASFAVLTVAGRRF